MSRGRMARLDWSIGGGTEVLERELRAGSHFTRKTVVRREQAEQELGCRHLPGHGSAGLGFGGFDRAPQLRGEWDLHLRAGVRRACWYRGQAPPNLAGVDSETSQHRDQRGIIL